MKAKKIIIFLILISVSVLLTYTSGAFRYSASVSLNIDTQNSMFKQKIIKTLETPEKVKVLYYKNKLMGIINDEEKIDELLMNTYQSSYEKKFPNTELGLSTDLYYNNEYSYQKYENKDNDILLYIKDNDLFSIKTNKVTFSNGSVLYVSDLDEFDKAQKNYIHNFVDQKSYRNLHNNEKNKYESEFGKIITSYEFEEAVSTSKSFSKHEILRNAEDIEQWFFYGYSKSRQTYIVEDGDTVQGVASKNGLEINNLLALNKKVIKDENQLLEQGLALNVTRINSPVNLKVEKEAINKVTIYPDVPEYVEDNTLAYGVEKVVQEEKFGYRKVRMKEIYKNGIMIDNEELESEILEVPLRKIIRKGIKKSDDGLGIYSNEGESIGVGNFRYPVDNPGVTCGWMCYRGHSAMDVQNRYDKYGEVIAADNGTIIVNSYHPVNGNWMEIDHGNGFVTYYGHMSEPGFLSEGSTVVKGQVIGKIGMSGVATGPHVHFEIRYQNEKMDPAMYLQ